MPASPRRRARAPAAARLAATLLAATLLAAALLAAALLAGCAAPPALAPPPGAAGACGPEGRLLVASSPSGARIIIDGSPTGFRTPTAVPHLPAGAHRLILSLAGHRNWEGRVALPPGGEARVEATLEATATGALAVASVPAGAAVYIDGQPFGSLVTPADVAPLPVGTHTVQLRRDGYEPWSQAVVILQDRRPALSAALTPARRNLGHVVVQTQPPRARVALDGFPTGKLTPDTLYALQPGAHGVELALAGYLPWRGTVTVREGRTENLLVTLQRVPAQDAGSARIESDPPGATVRLDGAPLDRETPADIAQLAARTYEVEVSRPGFRPWRGELRVRPCERTLLAVRLDLDGRYGGSIRVESDPAGAAIAVDDRATGAVTPALLPNLAPAGHRVALSLPGHRPWVRMVQVRPGATEALRARLVPRPWRVVARVAAARAGVVDVEVAVHGADGRPAEGELEFVLPDGTGTGRATRVTLAGGVALQSVPAAPAAAELFLLVRIGAQREEIVLRRASSGWEISLAE